MSFIRQEELNMKNNFDWVCDDTSLLENWLDTARKTNDRDEYGFIVSIRTGALCYDLIERKVENNFYLYAEFYVGGVDTGYGYGKLSEDEDYDYPYDYYDEADYYWETDKIINEDEDSLLKIIEEELEAKISEKSEEYEYCSLIDKANEALKVW